MHPFDVAILKEGLAPLQALKTEQIYQRVELVLEVMLVRQALAGYRHLRDAAASTTEAGMHTELSRARDCFAVLCELDPQKHISVPTLRIMGFALWHRPISTIPIICAGYHGSFIYFSAMKEHANALRYVYECTRRFPEQGLELFSSAFFSKDYRTLIQQEQGFAETEIAKTQAEIDEKIRSAHVAVMEHLKQSSRWRLDIAPRLGQLGEMKMAVPVLVNTSALRNELEAPVAAMRLERERRIQALVKELLDECDARLAKVPAGPPEITLGLKYLRDALGIVE